MLFKLQKSVDSDQIRSMEHVFDGYQLIDSINESKKSGVRKAFENAWQSNLFSKTVSSIDDARERHIRFNDNVSMSEEDFKNGEFENYGIKWTPGITYNQVTQQFRHNLYEKAHETLLNEKPTHGLIKGVANLLGHAVDPVSAALIAAIPASAGMKLVKGINTFLRKPLSQLASKVISNGAHGTLFGTGYEFLSSEIDKNSGKEHGWKESLSNIALMSGFGAGLTFFSNGLRFFFSGIKGGTHLQEELFKGIIPGSYKIITLGEEHLKIDKAIKRGLDPKNGLGSFELTSMMERKIKNEDIITTLRKPLIDLPNVKDAMKASDILVKDIEELGILYQKVYNNKETVRSFAQRNYIGNIICDKIEKSITDLSYLNELFPIDGSVMSIYKTMIEQGQTADIVGLLDVFKEDKIENPQETTMQLMKFIDKLRGKGKSIHNIMDEVKINSYIKATDSVMNGAVEKATTTIKKPLSNEEITKIKSDAMFKHIVDNYVSKDKESMNIIDGVMHSLELKHNLENHYNMQLVATITKEIKATPALKKISQAFLKGNITKEESVAFDNAVFKIFNGTLEKPVNDIENLAYIYVKQSKLHFGMLQESGLNIKQLFGRISSIKYNKALVGKMGRDAFTELMVKNTDINRMLKIVGKKENINTFISDVYDSIIGNSRDVDNLMLKYFPQLSKQPYKIRKMEMHRILHPIDATAHNNILSQVSGQNSFQMLFNEMNDVAFVSAYSKNWGPQGMKAMLNDVFNKSKEMIYKTIENSEDSKMIKRLKKQANALDLEKYQSYIDLFEKADSANQNNITRLCSTVRQIVSTASLGNLSIRSMPDIMTLAMQMKDFGHGFFRNLYDIGLLLFRRKFSALSIGEQDVIKYIGDILLTTRNSMSQSILRYSIDGTAIQYGQIISKILNTYSLLNGSHFWDQGIKTIAMHKAALDLGWNLSNGKILSTTVENTFRKTGLFKYIDLLRNESLSSTHTGGRIFDPNKIINLKDSVNLRNKYNLSTGWKQELMHSMDHTFRTVSNNSVLMPGIIERTALTMGTKSNTFLGQLVRFFAQFKSYPTAFLIRVLGGIADRGIKLSEQRSGWGKAGQLPFKLYFRTNRF
nr:MAG: hypothetical protein B6I27_02290 [Erwiniaceae bacterium 4572_131]